MSGALRAAYRIAAIAAAIVAQATLLFAQGPRGGPPRRASAQAMAQIDALIAEKHDRSPVQRKIDSQLLYGTRIIHGRAVAAGVPTLRVTLPMTADNRVVLDVRGRVSAALLARIRAAGGDVVDTSPRDDHLAVRAPLDAVESIAAIPDVQSIAPELGWMTSRSSSPALRLVTGPADARQHNALSPERRATGADALTASLREVLDRRAPAFQQSGSLSNTGTVDSQGDATHRAAEGRSTFGVSGAGIRIGVLSDGVDGLAASQANGNLGAVTVLAGQAGRGSEGTAMLEIVADLAPGAQLYFATANGGVARFAQNIRDLRAAGCDIIVDDVFYYVESPFQDGQLRASDRNSGVIAQAVKDVAASGALYFSSAGNSGNLDSGTSGTWEGDFADGGAISGAIAAFPGETGRVHSFGGATFDTLVISGNNLNTLYWSDPLGASNNDYDLFLLDSSGTSVISAGTNAQTGTQDPFEFVSAGSAGQQLVIVKFSGAARYLHLSTNRGRLSIATAGQIHGHAATSAPNTFGVAATPVCSGSGSNGSCTSPFTSGSRIETFSSDGPRRIFYDANGAAFTPGNVSSSGGMVLNKPDLTAADGVSTSVAGFSSFYGTSAAAPHLAAIAALVKSANAGAPAGTIASAIVSSAIDIQSPGLDRDSGYGIAMAFPAIQAMQSSSPPPPPVVPSVRPSASVDFDGDSRADLSVWRASSGTWLWATSSSGFSDGGNQQLGDQSLGDVPFTGDLDGDGKADLMVWRASAGTWYWLTSSSGYTQGGQKQWGNQSLGDTPLVGDIDGDGKTDLIVWRASEGRFYWTTSSTSYADGGSRQWGNSAYGDVPFVGDVDGDNKADLIVWRASTGIWYWTTSSTGYLDGGSKQWGNQSLGDVPLIGDIDGDRKMDFVVWRAPAGTWYWTTSSTSYTDGDSRQWGNQSLGDVPRLRDFDGDGRMDLTVWRASTGTWYWLTSSAGYASSAAGSRQFGNQGLGDTPIR